MGTVRNVDCHGDIPPARPNNLAMMQNLPLDLRQQREGLVDPPVVLEEPRPLAEPLHRLVVVQDLLAELVVAPLAERDLLVDEPLLLEKGPHPHVGEPQVMPRDGRASLLDAGHVEQPAAAAAGDGLLAGAVLAEPGVVGLSVGADGRERDPG